MRNHQSRPTGFEPFSEVNAISFQTRGYGHGCGRNPWYHGSYGNNSSNSQKMIAPPKVEQDWGKTRKWEVFTR